MKHKRQLLIFILAIFSAIFIFAALNYFCNPFGAFENDFWFSYSMTRNPRTAKISYLELYGENYDSFVVGSSGSSAFVTEKLEEVTGEKFYNCFYYGADMKDVKDTVLYLKKFKPKQILFPLTFSFAENYDTGEDDLHYRMNYKASGKDRREYILDYLFLDINYVLDLKKAKSEDSYIPKAFDVFVEKTGNYDKRVRDVEPIGDLNEYLKKYPEIIIGKEPVKMKYMNEFFEDLKYILDFCKAEDIEIKIILNPILETSFRSYSEEDKQEFIERLSEITDFWDFTNSSISYDSRYFYDSSHYRNSVADMMVEKIYDVKNVYIPEDFGMFVKKNSEYKLEEKEKIENDTALKILMFNNIENYAQSENSVSITKFGEILEKIEEYGYETVAISDIENYVKKGIPLPKKPIMLTFDDGYSSQYEIAYQKLKEKNMKAVFAPIGVLIGKEEYKDTKQKIIPHYTLSEIKEMKNSNLIEFASLGYDISGNFEYEKNPRENILIKENEKEEKYIEEIRSDLKKSKQILESQTEEYIKAFVYPEGKYDELSSVLVNEAGFEITFSAENKENIIVKGLPQSLSGLKRILVNEYTDISELLSQQS